MPTFGAIAQNAQGHLQLIKDELTEKLTRQRQIELYVEAVKAYKIMAFVALLDRAEVKEFFGHLMSVVVNDLYLLEKHNIDPVNAMVPASHLDGLYCALICEDDAALKKICQLMAGHQMAPEYDDEFLLALFLKKLILQCLFNEPAASDMRTLLDQVEDYREDDALIVTFLRGLYEQVIGAAEKAPGQVESDFLVWHESMVDQINARADSSSAPYSMQVTRYVSLEGLALIKLAERLGYAFSDNIQLIPAAARTPPSIDKMALVDRLQ